MSLSNKVETKRPKKTLDSRWYKADGKDEEEKKKTETLLHNNSVIFDRLKGIIEEEFNASIADGEHDFNSGWAYREAFNKGLQKAYKKIYSILP